jgi:hypothetical protein
MTTCRGVITGRLLVSTAIMPQLHPLPAPEKTQALE